MERDDLAEQLPTPLCSNTRGAINWCNVGLFCRRVVSALGNMMEPPTRLIVQALEYDAIKLDLLRSRLFGFRAIILSPFLLSLRYCFDVDFLWR